MATTRTAAVDPLGIQTVCLTPTPTARVRRPAPSRGGIAAGAAAGASLSLILLIPRRRTGLVLGIAIGPVSVVSAASFGVSTIVWLTLTQLLSSAMGATSPTGCAKWMDTDPTSLFP